MTALRLQEKCDDHAEKNNTRKDRRSLFPRVRCGLLLKISEHGSITTSILRLLLIIAGPVQEYLELIEMCKISNRIDS